ncbi:MAG TPA: hypothetical protein VN915_05030 [Elusimicrobiota bacterium]|nr:hypothetical protein [Elusimicrobiota bacterium]
MRLVLLAAVLIVAAASARAEDVVVVAPESPSGPYREALQGVCDALGSCPAVLAAGDEVPPGVRVVIALGGRAARQPYSARTALVTALSPGFEARSRPGSGAVARVRMTFSPENFARRLLLLKPGARSAALLWSEPASRRFSEAVREAGKRLGLAVTTVEVSEPGAVPKLLRDLSPVDSLWLAPDSALVTPMVFDAACEYARSAGVSFFAPAPALAERCGLAGLAPDFRSAGLRAGAAAREALAGSVPDVDAYPAPPGPESNTEVFASSRTRAGR